MHQRGPQGAEPTPRWGVVNDDGVTCGHPSARSARVAAMLLADPSMMPPGTAAGMPPRRLLMDRPDRGWVDPETGHPPLTLPAPRALASIAR